MLASCLRESSSSAENQMHAFKDVSDGETIDAAVVKFYPDVLKVIPESVGLPTK